MTLEEYQKRAMTTCMASSENFSYMFLNLVGEVGEFASKVAKAIRKEENCIEYNDLGVTVTNNEELQKEAGDILWQLSGLCTVMGWKLEDIAQQNLDKLASRQQRNVIDGSGDNR
jgi:NTP pyrophosphatase (non-canonical NTP hydrolase)